MLLARGGEGTLGRMRAFSDGVFSIVITLLVLNLSLPKVKARTDAELLALLRPLGVSFAGYLVTFLLVGVFWMVHVATDRVVRTADRRMLWVNVVSLFPVTLLPFTNDLNARFSAPLAFTIYAANVALAAIGAMALWFVVVRDGHVVATPEEWERFVLVPWRTGIVAAVYGLAIPVATHNPGIGKFVPLLLPIGFRLVARFAPKGSAPPIARPAVEPAV